MITQTRAARRPARVRTRLAAVAASAAAIALLAACGSGSTAGSSTSSSAAAPVAGGTYVHAIEGLVTCLDGAQQANHWNLNVIRQLVDSLVDVDPDTGEIVPWIAESWDISDDASEFTFHLVDGATFSDGTAIDADAVVANFARIAQLGAQASGASPWFSDYKDSEAVDASTVKVTFSRPNAQFLEAVANSWFGLISPADLKAKTPEQLCAGDYAGSGPFVLDNLVENQEVDLVKRTGYDSPSSLAKHEGDAYLDKLVFKEVTESSVRAGLVTSGEANSASAIAWQDEQTVAASGSLLTANQPGITETWIVNQESWLYDDEPVRQAIKYAINSQEVIDTVYGPTFSPRSSVITKTTPGYTDLSADLAFDPDKANQLLDADGWAKGSDGVRTKDGTRLSVNVIAVTTDLEILQQQLAAVGIEYKIRQLDGASYGEAQKSGDYDIIAWTMTRADPSVLAAAFASGDGALSWANAKPSDFDDVLATLQSTVDQTKRAEIAATAQKYLIENAWAIPIVDRAWTYGLAKTSQGLRLDGETRLVFYDTSVSK